MRKYIYLTTIGIVTCGAPYVSRAQELSVDQAVKILEDGKPILHPWIELGATDPDEQKAAEKLYDSQIKAIAALSNATKPDVAALLIPYLDYPAKGYVPSRFYNAHGEFAGSTDINIIRSRWPAFDAILNNPHASQALTSYILDQKNPPNLRVAAFHVLRYENQNSFKEVALKFRHEFPGLGIRANAYLKAIEDGELTFGGVEPFDPKQ